MATREYYAGAPNAFAGGQVFAQDMTKRRLQMNALNALIGRFGPEAAMPEEQAMLQRTQQATQLQPHVVGAAERATAGAEANVAEFGPQAGDLETEEIERRRNEQRRNILHRAVSALKMVRDKKGDLPGALQQFGQIISRIGMPADELAELQQNILTNPDSLDELDTMLRGTGADGVRAVGNPIAVYDNEGQPRLMQYMNDGSTRIIPNVSPASTVQGEERLRQGATRLSQGARRLGLDEAKARGFNAPTGYQIWEDVDGTIHSIPIVGSAQEFERESELSKRAGELAQNIMSAETTVVAPAQSIKRSGQDVITFMDRNPLFNDASLWQGVGRRIANVLPDSDVREISTMLETLKANIGFAQLSNMTRGLGAVSERELMQLERVLGSLTTDRQPAQLRRDIVEVLRLHEDIVQKTQQALTRQREEFQRLQEQREELRSRSGGAGRPPAAPAGSTEPSAEEPTLEELLQRYSGGN